jgi:2-hydroxy-6-oxonona-2,4-dienedioate hydrolase
MSITSLLFGNKHISEEYFFLQHRAPIRSVPAHVPVKRKIKGNHIYLEAGHGRPVIFCHGLFGGIYNIDIVCEEIAKEYRFLMPYLPMYDMALKDCTVKKLGDYLETFIENMQIDEAIVMGSSMGGGAALYYACKPGNKLKGLVLCGSSGLSNIPLAKGYFKRKNFDFVKESTRDIFFNRSVPGDEMMKDVFNAIQSNEVVLRSIRFTKSATKHTMHSELPGINVPALLVWGKQDPITPAEIAPEFQKLLPNAELKIIDQCGHVPTQEKPYQFLEYFFEFVKKINY